MDAYMMVIAILLPMLGGALIPLLPFGKRNVMAVYIEAIVIATSVITFLLIFNMPQDALVLFRFTGQLSISLRLDGTGSVFATILAFMWPLATLYSVEYMKHEKHEKIFFMFYTVTYGVTLGIAMAEDIVTMYFFYEMLTMVTLPLVLHTLSREAVLAARTYLYYSLGGAAFAFIGMIFILMYGTTPDFTPGGVIDVAQLGENANFLLFVYVLCFCGFSVK
ncbi:MAG: proton-conducting membrane transporter, partial [Lachnospiraceae bacterium]|nr:proton-conducting membrane transporter [Lachnospiraceae bacterium]